MTIVRRQLSKETPAFLWLLLFSLFAKIIFVIAINNKMPVFGDALDYINAAISLVKHREYPEVGSMPFFRAPFYPIYISVFYVISPKYYLFLLRLSQVFLSVLTGILIYKVAENFFSKKIASITACIFLFHPFFNLMLIEVQTETLFLLLNGLALFCTLGVADDNHKLIKIIFVGLFGGMAVLTRPAFGIFFPLVLIWFGILNRKRPFLFIRDLLILLFSLTLVVGPWVYRNFIRYGEFIYCNDAGGLAFYLYNSKEYLQYLTAEDPATYKKLTNEIIFDKWKRQIESFERSDNYSKLTPKKRERLWYQAAFDYVKGNKIEWAGLLVLKAIDYLRLYIHPYAYGYKLAATSFFLTGIFLLLGTAGIVLSLNQHINRGKVLFILAYFLASIFAHVLYLSSVRYRIVFIDVWLYMFSVYFVSFMVQHIINIWKVRNGS